MCQSIEPCQDKSRIILLRYRDEKYFKDEISLNGPGFIICSSPFWPFPSLFFLDSYFIRHQALDKLKVRQQEMCKKVMASVLLKKELNPHFHLRKRPHLNPVKNPLCLGTCVEQSCFLLWFDSTWKKYVKNHENRGQREFDSGQKSWNMFACLPKLKKCMFFFNGPIACVFHITWLLCNLHHTVTESHWSQATFASFQECHPVFKARILIGFSIINHPFWGFSPYFWKHPYQFVSDVLSPIDSR